LWHGSGNVSRSGVDRLHVCHREVKYRDNVCTGVSRPGSRSEGTELAGRYSARHRSSSRFQRALSPRSRLASEGFALLTTCPPEMPESRHVQAVLRPARGGRHRTCPWPRYRIVMQTSWVGELYRVCRRYSPNAGQRRTALLVCFVQDGGSC